MATYIFDYIVLWFNPDLTSCEYLATAQTKLLYYNMEYVILSACALKPLNVIDTLMYAGIHTRTHAHTQTHTHRHRHTDTHTHCWNLLISLAWPDRYFFFLWGQEKIGSGTFQIPNSYFHTLRC